MVALSLRNLEGGFQTMSTKNKHMSLQDRIEIQECLSKGMTFKKNSFMKQEEKQSSGIPTIQTAFYTIYDTPCPMTAR